MRSERSVGMVMIGMVVVAINLAGCGSGSAPGGPGPIGTSAATGQAGPPASWVAQPPCRVIRFGPAALNGYTPAQIRHAYGFDQVTPMGGGQKIAIIDAYGSPTIQHDLNVFCARFGLATTMVRLAYPSGKPTKVNAGWAFETSLDVEWAHVIAPKATILLVVAPSASFASLLPAVDYGASHAAQVSMSWGGSEFPDEASFDSHFNRAGVSFAAASSDSGAASGWPAASPWVTCVGATTLVLNGAGAVRYERGWSGSGGGRSLYEPEPAFQNSWQSSGKRQMPDVSDVGDPDTGLLIYDSIPYLGSSGWSDVGGTSAGTPQWAALYALANSMRPTPLTSTNMALYDLGSPRTFATYFRDITQGCNVYFCASPGYDQVTGLGSPRANTLVPDLAGSEAQAAR